MVSRHAPSDTEVTEFSSLLSTVVTGAVDVAAKKVTPDTVAKDFIYVGLNGFAQRGRQHPAHAVLQPGRDVPGLDLLKRSPAGHSGLAAVESYIRQATII